MCGEVGRSLRPNFTGFRSAESWCNTVANPCLTTNNQDAHSPQCVRDMKREKFPISDQVAYQWWI